MKRGRLEAMIYQAANYTATVTGTASGTATVTASSTRYPTDLLSAVASAFSTTTTDTVTVTGSWGESGTGKVTISSTANIAVTWVSTALRDLLGFTGNLSAATSHTSTKHAQLVWLPDCPMKAKYGPNDAGHTKTDRSELMSPRGDVTALMYQSRTILPTVLWSHVTRARARIQGETVTNESFEQWWKDSHGGNLTYCNIAPKVKLVWDADTPGTYTEYRLTGRDSTDMERVVDEWSGLFGVELTNLIKVPS